VLSIISTIIPTIFLTAIFLTIFAAMNLRAQDNTSSNSNTMFAQALQDYTKNQFFMAHTEFGKVTGAHASEAQHYMDNIDAYVDDMQVANSIMSRKPDELDAPSLKYAIQRIEDALKIKADGPKEPAKALEKARELYAPLADQRAKGLEERDRNYCEKAREAAQHHRYALAGQFSCILAQDNVAYSCGGDEAVHMCQQMSDMAKTEDAADDSPEDLPKPTPGNLIDRGRTAYEKNDFEKARTLLGKAPADQKSVADEYLDKISRYQGFMIQAENSSKTSAYEEARVAFAKAASIKPDGPGNPQAQALLMELEEGMDQFYSGNYVSAMQSLEGYAHESTEKAPLAHFYLGASKLAQFFLTGGEDASLRQDALNDLRIAKQAGFKAQELDVSPRILQAYKDLAF
jgi:hypothetical protein